MRSSNTCGMGLRPGETAGMFGPGEETHHSALYVPKVSAAFFRDEFPAFLEGESAYCGRG